MACPYCGGERFHASQAGRKDLAIEKVLRFLIHRGLCRCERCNELFEAPSAWFIICQEVKRGPGGRSPVTANVRVGSTAYCSPQIAGSGPS